MFNVQKDFHFLHHKMVSETDFSSMKQKLKKYGLIISQQKRWRALLFGNQNNNKN